MNFVFLKRSILIFIMITIIFTIFPSLSEVFTDFSIPKRSSVDIYTYNLDKPHPPDNCGDCDGICTNERHLNCPNNLFKPIKLDKSKWVYVVSKGDYLTYDANNGMLVMTKDAYKWELKPEMGGVRIYTKRTPHIYLEKKGDEISESYFLGGKEQLWRVEEHVKNPKYIAIRQGNMYLKTDGIQVYLSPFLHVWNLGQKKVGDGNAGKEGFEVNDFPDTPSAVWNEWNIYYSKFWNGTYLLRSPDDHLIINLDKKGNGHIYTKDKVWKVESIASDILRGCNKDTYIYVEMLKKGQPGYNADLPQIKALTKDRANGRLQTLIGLNPYNLNAYSYKISGEVKGEVGHTDELECYDNYPTFLVENSINKLASGYNMPTINFNMAEPCPMLEEKPPAPKHVGYGEIHSNMGESLSNMYGIFHTTYVNDCGRESEPSTKVQVPLTNPTTNLKHPILELRGSNNKKIKRIKLYWNNRPWKELRNEVLHRVHIKN